MKAKSKYILFTAVVVIVAVFFIILKAVPSKNKGINVQMLRPVSGNVRLTVSTTGTVLPKNRLELKPSVAGRIDRVLVKEGNRVRKGQILVLMSSTDRAALLDAARLQGPGALKYWEDAYKPIPVVAPIRGTVIVRSVEPGQTVTTADDIIVISDRLIVKAEVDETDIGRVKVGQPACITLDSHPDITVKGKVSHISYESTTVNSVTVYYVEITPVRVPAEYRSGMSAGIEIIENEKKNVILVPRRAMILQGDCYYVMVNKGENTRPEKREVRVGIEGEENVEILSGLSTDEILLVSSKKIMSESPSSLKNPFMPERPRRRK